MGISKTFNNNKVSIMLIQYCYVKLLTKCLSFLYLSLDTFKIDNQRKIPPILFNRGLIKDADGGCFVIHIFCNLIIELPIKFTSNILKPEFRFNIFILECILYCLLYLFLEVDDFLLMLKHFSGLSFMNHLINCSLLCVLSCLWQITP